MPPEYIDKKNERSASLQLKEALRYSLYLDLRFINFKLQELLQGIS